MDTYSADASIVDRSCGCYVSTHGVRDMYEYVIVEDGSEDGDSNAARRV